MSEIHPEGTLTIRAAKSSDAELIFHWRNIPEIVDLGRSRRPVSWSEHERWFTDIIGDETRHRLLIVNLDDEPIGQVRLDEAGERQYEISVYLLPSFTGRGLGVVALDLACRVAFEELGARQVSATIRAHNSASLRAFQKAGFLCVPDSEESGFTILHRLRPPTVPHNRVTADDDDVAHAVAAIESGFWACGPRVQDLEATLQAIGGVSHAVAVASGLSALRLTLIGLGVEPRDRVLVPAYSCVALPNAVLACGADPVAVDVVPDEWNIDPADASIKARLPRVRAMIAVHTFGVPARIEALSSGGIPVVEDCAHAFGIDFGGAPLGSHGHASVLSFYATKLVGAGEGGAVLTNDPRLSAFVRDRRDYADKPANGARLNDKMTDIEGAIANGRLRKLSDAIARREALATAYGAGLGDEAELLGIALPDHSSMRVWYRYCVQMSGVPAGTLVRRLREHGIEATEPVSDWRDDRWTSECPVADRAYEGLVSLPLYPSLSDSEQERVIDGVLRATRALRRRTRPYA